MLSERHLKESYSAFCRFTNDLDSLVAEIFTQINSENEVCKLRNSLMKIKRAPDESLATVIGRIKTLYISLYRIRYPTMDQASIDKRCEEHTLNTIDKLVAP